MRKNLRCFFPANPTALLNTVWLNNGIHYGFRGRQEHTTLRLGHLKLLKDGTGTEYVEFFGMFNVQIYKCWDNCKRQQYLA